MATKDVSDSEEFELDDELLDSPLDQDEESVRPLSASDSAAIRRKIEDRLERKRLRDELGVDDYFEF